MTRRNRLPDITRRQALQGMAAVGAAALAGRRAAHAQTPDGGKPRFLIVLAAGGGASIIDGPMAIRASESANAADINTMPDQVVLGADGHPFRAVDMDRDALGAIPAPFKARQKWFVDKHASDMMVSTWTRTSVNHTIGQRRSVTGNEAWAGRTLQELVALTHGKDHPLPNVHLIGGSGTTQRGTDASIPSWAFGEQVTDPRLWPLALDGQKGLNIESSDDLLSKARALRDQRLDPRSRFGRIFGRSPRLQHWQEIRGERRAAIEAGDFIRKLMLAEDSADFPLGRYGLQASPELARIRERFPDLEEDPLQAQAAMAFLLIKYGVSVTVTLGPSFDVEVKGDENIFEGGGIIGGGGGIQLEEGIVINPPLAFDFSHQAHRSTQALMWNRLYSVADGLIELLKGEEFAGGESLWDQSMIYIAPDFGRTKQRPSGADEFSSSHDLNNGVVMLSPLVNGNTLLGGVNPDTGFTYGFDPQTGAPDTGRNMEEAEIFAGQLQALGVDTSPAGLPDMPAMRKG
ncbi:MAG: hypothetical protein ACE366_14500 [Bradymonadia bacterium]